MSVGPNSEALVHTFLDATAKTTAPKPDLAVQREEFKAEKVSPRRRGRTRFEHARNAAGERWRTSQRSEVLSSHRTFDADPEHQPSVVARKNIEQSATCAEVRDSVGPVQPGNAE